MFGSWSFSQTQIICNPCLGGVYNQTKYGGGVRSYTKIKTQTFSLILFGAFQEKKFLKDNSHASYEDFLFIAVRKRDKFFTVVSKMKKVSIF